MGVYAPVEQDCRISGPRLVGGLILERAVVIKCTELEKVEPSR